MLISITGSFLLAILPAVSAVTRLLLFSSIIMRQSGFAWLLLTSVFGIGAKAIVRGVNLGGWLVTEPWFVHVPEFNRQFRMKI